MLFYRRQTAREEKAAGPKMRALQETVLRMNEKNVRLQQENKTLKEDLEKMMEESAQTKARNSEYDCVVSKCIVIELKINLITKSQHNFNILHSTKVNSVMF